jgi:hypothetical protein
VHNRPQAETGGGTQNTGRVGSGGNTFPAATRPSSGSLTPHDQEAARNPAAEGGRRKWTKLSAGAQVVSFFVAR